MKLSKKNNYYQLQNVAFNGKSIKHQPEKNSLSFKGYFACPLKELYLQPEVDYGGFILAKELKDIIDKLGFKLRMQLNDLVMDVPANVDNDWFKYANKGNSKRWGQDEKFFIHTDNDEIIATNGVTEPGLENIGELLAKQVGLTNKNFSSFLDGGNYFIGKDNEGKQFAIVGNLSLIKTAKKFAFKDKGIDWKTTSDYIKTNEDQESLKYYETNKETYLEMARKAIAKDLHLQEDRIHYIKQPSFHLDMAIRPLNYPYVLVNDPKLMIKEFMKIYKNPDTPQKTKTEIKEYITKTFVDLKKEDKQNNYASAKETVKELKKIGLEPILVPGAIYSTEVNFMNSVVHQKPDGTIAYITNKNYYPYLPIDLNEIFENYIKEHVRSISEIHFVNGDFDKYGDNYVSRSIRDYRCGLHCMVTERPDFDRWV